MLCSCSSQQPITKKAKVSYNLITETQHFQKFNRSRQIFFSRGPCLKSKKISLIARFDHEYSNRVCIRSVLKTSSNQKTATKTISMKFQKTYNSPQKLNNKKVQNLLRIFSIVSNKAQIFCPRRLFRGPGKR